MALRFRSLWRRLGTGFEPAGSFADADAWYCILEGTAETSVAEAQARALVDMLASYITGPGRDADVLLAVDEFSAAAARAADLGAVQAGPVPGTGRAGLGAVVARAGRR